MMMALRTLDAGGPALQFQLPWCPATALDLSLPVEDGKRAALEQVHEFCRGSSVDSEAVVPRLAAAAGGAAGRVVR